MGECGADVGKCVGEMGCVEKCGVGVGKCVGVWGKVRRSEVVWEMWGRCGKVCWGVEGSENRCGEGEEKWESKRCGGVS